MKAILMNARGSADEVLAPSDVPEPRLAHGHEILVRIQAAGVNPVDAKQRVRGPYKGGEMPVILGCDAAGVVEEAGTDCKRFAPGDAVYFCSGGIGDAPGTNWAEARLRNLRIGLELMLSPMYYGMHEERVRQAAILERCGALFDAGRLRVVVSDTFPLAEAARAHRAIETGSTTGKLVLVVND